MQRPAQCVSRTGDLRAAAVSCVLVAFCIGYPSWLLGVEFAARQWYFRPLCQAHAEQRALDLIDYQRGGRGSPPSCVLAGATVPIAEIAGDHRDGRLYRHGYPGGPCPVPCAGHPGKHLVRQDRRRRRGP